MALSPAGLESAWRTLPELQRACREGRLALFLDFDGTLAPIRDHPDEVTLDEGLKQALARAARRCFVAIVSGRDLADLEARIGLADLCYAGSHGFEIRGPNGLRHEFGKEAVAALDRFEPKLRAALAGLSRVWVERKRYALAVHLRRAGEVEAETAVLRVRALAADHPELALSTGKKVLEIRPKAHWHKGTAVLWLLAHLGDPQRLPVFIGDDVTDEDAFRSLEGRGVTVLVAEEDRPTRARYRLSDPGEVARFLRALIADCAAEPGGG